MEYSEVKEQIKQKLPVQKEFGDSENLLELGLSSIVIMRLVNQWRKQGVKVAFGTLMEHPTLKEWWKIIQKGTKKKGKKAKAEKRDIIMERDMRKPFPLTDVQYAYWVGREDNQVLGGIGCHAYLEFDGYGVVPERLQEAWSRIQYHHPMLRASFSENGMQKIESKPYSEKIKINDFSLLTETEAEQEAQAVRRRLSHRKLKIEEGEVAGLELTLLPGNKTRLHIDLDLLIADVQSLQILLRDLAMVYSGVELPEESKDWNFAAYLEQQNVEDREERKKAKEYWSARLKNLPQGPDMPLAKRPEEVKNPVFHRRVVRIGKEEWDCLQRRAKEYQTTPAMLLLTIPRGYEQIVAVLAVLISGNVYVPVSCEQPSERRKLIHEKTDIHYVITTAEKEKQIEWPENVEIWCVEKLLENELLENYPKIYPEDSAYIIMTSGSTGQPKGVEMSHANAWNTIEYINRKYCVDQTDAILAVSALDFDLSVYDQFGLLSAGGKIILIPESESKNPDYWLKMIFEYHITRWNSVPILGEMLFECWKAQKKEKIPFRTAFYSGDWTLLYMVDMFYEAVEDGTLIVLGGTTETGIWSNEQIVKLPLPENWKTIPYGRPLENQAYRVVDDFGRDCPFWVEGELWIGGEGVGKGYRGDEVLTKQKYIMDCFGRWYRTGDNGCFWNDGTIEYRGRRDFQVKVKGHRIELGEIEAILNKIAGVKKSIVCAVEHNNRKNMLVAVVVKESPNINEEFLMQNLKSKLPVYMLPTKIIFEDKLPVGKNAKQDRKEVVRWIKAHEDRNIENEEKLTPCETRMLKIWKRLLGNDNITKKDNYFVCGGDSLLAVRMTAEIEAEFGVKVSIGIIFENNTVESLAKRISSIKEKRKPNIEVVQHNEQERFQEFLTTEMQYAYWIGRQNVYALGNVSSYCYYEIVSKNLSIERLERAWNELIIENDALRLVFSKDGKRQKVLESVPYYNLKVYNTDLDGKETVESIRDDMSQQIMEASQWPLFDIRVSICQDKNIVHVGIDNLIMDARSVLSILYQWTQRYVGNNKSKLESVSFRDYVCAMNERNMLLKDQEYWESRISHFPAYPKIPTKKMPQEITKQVFKRYTKEMTKHKWELLKKIGEKQNITASNILLTAYALMLWEESGSNHFALNITIDKRWNLSKELRHTIGDFTGNILLEIKIDEKKTFIELAHEIQNQLMKDLEHSDFSGIKFQRELSKYDGKKFRYGIPFVYTSTLGMENENDNLFGEICYNITQTPQVWLDYQIQERQGALYLNWDYLQGLLDETQIENMIYKYSNLLDWLIENGDFLISEDNNYQEGIL